MRKYDSCIIQKILFLRRHYYLLLWRIYYAALKRFKIYDSITIDYSDDQDEMNYLSESSGSEADWQFFGETTNCIKYDWTI